MDCIVNQIGLNGSTTPRVSVLMPVFNTKTDELRAAIDSILGQTFPDFEFIIVNDGSTDTSVDEAVRSYNDGRIRYFAKPNGGIAETLNYGLARACGKYVARMDADDISLPERLERQVAYLDTHPELAIVGTWFETMPGFQVIRHPEEVKALDIFSGCVLAHPSVMFRKSEMDRHDLRYDPGMVPAEDYDLWTRAILKVKLGNVPEVLFRYRMNPGGISQTRRQAQLALTRQIQRRYLKALLSSPCEDAFLHSFRQLQLREVRTYRLLRIPAMRVSEDAGYRRYFLFGCIPVLKVRIKMGLSPC